MNFFTNAALLTKKFAKRLDFQNSRLPEPSSPRATYIIPHFAARVNPLFKNNFKFFRPRQSFPFPRNNYTTLGEFCQPLNEDKHVFFALCDSFHFPLLEVGPVAHLSPCLSVDDYCISFYHFHKFFHCHCLSLSF